MVYKNRYFERSPQNTRDGVFVEVYMLMAMKAHVRIHGGAERETAQVYAIEGD